MCRPCDAVRERCDAAMALRIKCEERFGLGVALKSLPIPRDNPFADLVKRLDESSTA